MEARIPTIVKWSLWALAVQGAFGGLGFIALGWEMLTGDGLTQGLAFAAFAVVVPPGLACIAAVFGLRMRREWGRRLAIVIHGTLAFLLAVPLLAILGEGATIWSGSWSISGSLTVMGILGPWLFAITANAIPMVGLFRAASRCWFAGESSPASAQAREEIT